MSGHIVTDTGFADEDAAAEPLRSAYEPLQLRVPYFGTACIEQMELAGTDFWCAIGGGGGRLQIGVARKKGAVCSPPLSTDSCYGSNHLLWRPRHRQEDQSSRTLSNPSWATEATSLPSLLKILPRVNPRAPPAVGLSIWYRSHSSARKGR